MIDFESNKPTFLTTFGVLGPMKRLPHIRSPTRKFKMVETRDRDWYLYHLTLKWSFQTIGTDHFIKYTLVFAKIKELNSKYPR